MNWEAWGFTWTGNLNASSKPLFSVTLLSSRNAYHDSCKCMFGTKLPVWCLQNRRGQLPRSRLQPSYTSSTTLGIVPEVSMPSSSAKNEWTQNFIKASVAKKNESQERGDIYLNHLLPFHVMLLIFKRISYLLSSPQFVRFASTMAISFPSML